MSVPMLGRARFSRSASWRCVLAIVGVGALLMVAYAPCINGGFVWDDDVNVTTNGALRGLHGLVRIWTDVTVTQQYYPLTHTSFWLQVQTTGLSPWPFHVANLALHAVTAWLLWRVLRRLTVRGAGLGAVLFALHPLNVESVAWITERKNVLSGALGLAAVLVYLDADERRESAVRMRTRARFAFAFALFVLALAAKTTVSMLPIGLAAALVFVRDRRPRDLAPLVPWLAAGGAAGLGTAMLERTRVGANGAEFAFGPAAHVLIAARAFVFYLEKLVLPQGLMFFYPRFAIDPSSLGAWIPLAVVAALFGIALALRPRLGNGPLTALVVYAVLIFPALGFFNVYFMRYAFVQNHFAYLATMPVAALSGALLSRLPDAPRFPDLGRAIVAAALACACAALSFQQAKTFRDYDTLFVSALEANPDAWPASYNLGLRAGAQGRRAEALELIESAARARPDDADIASSLGVALTENGQVALGVRRLREVASMRPDQPLDQLNLAAALDLAGQPAAAAAAYRQALRLRPDFPRAARQLAWLLATTRDPHVRDGAGALELAQTGCARATRELPRCLDLLAAAHAATGNFDAASASEARAMELMPDPGNPLARELAEHAALFAEHRALMLPAP